ncbi:MAG: relaxase/mobilization nuclease domain-containing protein [bacterium]|nr:relaxase/mobilization nuclease domain-containing protein [bacterium]
MAVARGLPQAVVKITSHNKGRANTRQRLLYISRDGEIPLETDEGTQLEGVAEIDAYLDAWAVDFGTRKNGRDAMSLVASVPPGMDRAAALNSARAFFAKAFGGNHAYAFAGHTEKDHFHVHAVVKMRGHDGRQLTTDKADLRRWREQFAEAANGYGLEFDASPRYARGKGRPGVHGVVHQIRSRGQIPRVDREAAEEALARVRDLATESSPAQEQQHATNARERVAYAKQARAVAEQARQLQDELQRVRSLEIASDLAVFAEAMPTPKTRVEALLAAVGRGQGNASKPGREETRKWTKTTERAIRDVTATFTDPKLQRRAIAARTRLSRVLASDQQQRGTQRDRGR